jgi:DNA-3-methyladenine glycosylase I
MKTRCEWAKGNELYLAYHDTEWGVPVHDDQQLFEFLILEGAHAGLSWAMILNKRRGYRLAYGNFDPQKVARYGDRKIEQLRRNPAIVRNKIKIRASIENAKAFLEVQAEFGSFDAYIWHFVGGKPKQNTWRSASKIPANTKESELMSRDLKKRGFKFVGSTICYAFMQAGGRVNDHLIKCYRYDELKRE